MTDTTKTDAVDVGEQAQKLISLYRAMKTTTGDINFAYDRMVRTVQALCGQRAIDACLDTALATLPNTPQAAAEREEFIRVVYDAAVQVPSEVMDEVPEDQTSVVAALTIIGDRDALPTFWATRRMDVLHAAAEFLKNQGVFSANVDVSMSPLLNARGLMGLSAQGRNDLVGELARSEIGPVIDTISATIPGPGDMSAVAGIHHVLVTMTLKEQDAVRLHQWLSTASEDEESHHEFLDAWNTHMTSAIPEMGDNITVSPLSLDVTDALIDGLQARLMHGQSMAEHLDVGAHDILVRERADQTLEILFISDLGVVFDRFSLPAGAKTLISKTMMEEMVADMTQMLAEEQAEQHQFDTSPRPPKHRIH